MQLLFKQRLFSWTDSYDIYDEAGNTAFVVKGRFSLGHKLDVYDWSGAYVAALEEEILHLLPQFNIYIGNQFVGKIKREFTFFRPKYSLECNNLHVEGDVLGWNYSVVNGYGRQIMTAEKQLWNFTDTYVINIPDSDDALISLMIVLAIDAANCDNG